MPLTFAGAVSLKPGTALGLQDVRMSGYCSVPGMLSSCLPVSTGCFNQGLPHMMRGFPHPHAELRICCISSSGIEKSIYLTEEFHDHFSGRLSALLALLAQRFVDSLVLEEDPGPSITVQGRLHCPNSVLYGVSGHTGIYSFPYSHKEEETTFCGLCFCSSACPIQCSGCLTSVRIRILRQEGHRPLLFVVFTTFLGTSRRFCDAVEKHPWCGHGVSACQREEGLTSNWELSCRQPTQLAASLSHLDFLRWSFYSFG